jgi:soluble lytic murein transglycosylase-like protein
MKIALALLLVSFRAFAGAASLDAQIASAAHRFRIDPNLVKAIIQTESGPLGSSAVSPKGAKGLMQVMPRTADEMGIANPHHALSNLMGACRYLRILLNRYNLDIPKALAAYNAGPSKVDRYKGIPPYRETQEYVRKVMRMYKHLRQMP